MNIFTIINIKQWAYDENIREESDMSSAKNVSAFGKVNLFDLLF